MKRHEAVIAAIVAYLMITAGVVWQFGAWGLLGAGVVLLGTVLFFFDVKEGP